MPVLPEFYALFETLNGWIWWDCLFQCLSWEGSHAFGYFLVTTSYSCPPICALLSRNPLWVVEIHSFVFPNMCCTLSRNPSATLWVEIMRHTARKSGFLLKYRAQTTRRSPTSPLPFSLAIFNSVPLCNSHLDFSQFSFGFLRTWALQFPLQFFSLA